MKAVYFKHLFAGINVNIFKHDLTIYKTCSSLQVVQLQVSTSHRHYFHHSHRKPVIPDPDPNENLPDEADAVGLFPEGFVTSTM